MASEFFHAAEAIVALIVGVAVIALLVSPRAQTASVIHAAASGLGNNLGVAEAPVTGASYQVDLSYPNSSPWVNSPFMG